MASFLVLSPSVPASLIARLDAEGHDVHVTANRAIDVPASTVVLVLDEALAGVGRRLRRSGCLVFGPVEGLRGHLLLRRAGIAMAMPLDAFEVDIDITAHEHGLVAPTVLHLGPLAFIDTGVLSTYVLERLEAHLVGQYVGILHVRLRVSRAGAIAAFDIMPGPANLEAFTALVQGDLGEQLLACAAGDLDAWLVDPSYPFALTHPVTRDVAIGHHVPNLAADLGMDAAADLAADLEHLDVLTDLDYVTRNPQFAGAAIDLDVLREILVDVLTPPRSAVEGDSPQTSSPAPGPVTDLGNTAVSEPAGMDAVSGDNAGDTGPTSAGGPT